MEERGNDLPREETAPEAQEQPAKPQWQQTKEGWYDKIPLTVKQLDIIIACGIGGLILISIIIALDAMGVF